MTTNEPDRFIRIGSVLDKTGLSRSSMYRYMELGTFPANFRIAERCVAWRQSDITAWKAKMAAAAPSPE